MANEKQAQCQANWSKDGWLLNAYHDNPEECVELVKKMRTHLGLDKPIKEERLEDSELLEGGVPQCPTHGIDMVERVRKSDGSKFWGCPNFPKCREVINI